jgi:hypothetical protein
MTRNQEILVGVGLLIAGMLWFGFQFPQTQPAQQTAAKEDNRPDLVGPGARLLRRAMRDPDSLKFEIVSDMADGSVCYTYRARNGFGGMNIGQAVMTPKAHLRKGCRRHKWLIFN